MKIVSVLIAFVILIVLGTAVHQFRQWNIRKSCETAVIWELHWEWRLRTDEVQSKEWLKLITKNMYKKATKDRVDKCTVMYEEGAE